MHRGPVNSCDPPVSPFDNGFSLFFSFLTSAIPLDFSLFLLHSGRHCCNLVHAQHRSLTFTFPCSFLTACYKKSSPRAILNLNSDDDDNGDTLPSIEDHYTLQVHWPSNTNGDWSFAWTMRGWLRPLSLHKNRKPNFQHLRQRFASQGPTSTSTQNRPFKLSLIFTSLARPHRLQQPCRSHIHAVGEPCHRGSRYSLIYY